MIEALTPLFGIIITLLCYVISLFLYNKTKIQLLNPVLLSTLVIILLIIFLGIPLPFYVEGAQYITAMLPFTIILLGLPLYRQLPLLIKHKVPILAGIIAGTITSAISIFSLCWLFKIDKDLLRSLIPKSITTPLGLIVSNSLEGIASITVIAIVFTGILGVLFHAPVFKILNIHNPIAKGVALGTASHAIGTSKALEIGETEGAMSSLSIILTGIITVITTPFFLFLLSI